MTISDGVRSTNKNSSYQGTVVRSVRHERNTWQRNKPVIVVTMGGRRKNIESEEGVLTKEQVKTKEPPLFRVILLNDHYTTMEFVVLVLETVFHHSAEDAERIMLQVHRDGSGTAGIYIREVAETKVAIVQQLAKQNEFPLLCRMEPV